MRPLRTLVSITAAFSLAACVNLLNFPEVPALDDGGADSGGNTITSGTDGGKGASDSGAVDSSVTDGASPGDGSLKDGALPSDGSSKDANGNDGSNPGTSGDSGGNPDGGGSSDANGCANQCSAGDTICADGGVYSCQLGDAACPTWSLSTTCGPHSACVVNADGGGAECACNTTSCTGPGSMCEGQNTIVTCATDDASCNYASAEGPCPSGELCGGYAPNATCALTCSDTCDGGTICEDGGIATCEKLDSGCFGYGPPVACSDSNMTCSHVGGQGVCTCIPSSVCSSSDVAVCNSGNTGYYSCTTDTFGCFMPQATPTGCTNGACYENGGATCCVNQCDAGATECAPSGSAASMCIMVNGCTAWSTPKACVYNAQCLTDAGQSSCECDPGLTSCSGACVNTTNDSNNCGGCGIVCNGSCFNNVCSILLATGPNLATAMAVDGTSVYWMSPHSSNDAGGDILKVNIDGGGYTTLASGLVNMDGIAVSNGYVYAVVNDAGSAVDSIVAVPINGGALSTVGSSSTNGFESLAVNGTTGYYLDQSSNLVATPLTVDAGSTTLLLASAFSGNFPQTLTYANGSLYLGADSNGIVVETLPLDGGALKTLATLSGNALYSIVANANDVYFTANLTGSSSVDLLRVGVDGGGLTTLSSSAFVPVALDPQNVYWGTNGDGIQYAPLGGGTPSTLAGVGLGLPSGDIGYGLVVDTTNVYWADTNGHIYKTPRP